MNESPILTVDQQLHLEREAERINQFGEQDLLEHHRSLVPVYVQQCVALQGDCPHQNQVDQITRLLGGCFGVYYQQPNIEGRRRRVIDLQRIILIQYNQLGQK